MCGSRIQGDERLARRSIQLTIHWLSNSLLLPSLNSHYIRFWFIAVLTEVRREKYWRLPSTKFGETRDPGYGNYLLSAPSRPITNLPSTSTSMSHPHFPDTFLVSAPLSHLPSKFGALQHNIYACMDKQWEDTRIEHAGRDVWIFWGQKIQTLARRVFFTQIYRLFLYTLAR